MLILRMILSFFVVSMSSIAFAQTPSQGPAGGIFSRSGTIVLKVPSFDAAWTQMAAAAQSRGGELVNSAMRTDQKGRKYGWMVFRLPVSQIPSMYTAAATAGKLYGQKFDAVPNQSDYESLARRAESLQRHEDRLAGILASPRRMRGGDILFLQERLFRADVDREMLLQQREDLMAGAQSGTLKLEIFEPNTMPAPESTAKIDLGQWYRFGLLRARHEFQRSAARVATGGAYTMIYAPIWGPLAVISLIILAVFWRMRRRIFEVLKTLLSNILRQITRSLIWLRDNSGRKIRLE